MKKNKYLNAGILIFSVIAIISVVGSLIRNPPAESPSTTSTTSTIVSSTPTITNTPDPCLPEVIGATIFEFDRISREFNDAFILAQNTPAAQLSENISELQRIRRSAEDFEIPICLTRLKQVQLGFMNSAIEATINLFSNFSGDPNKPITQEQVDTAVAMINQNMQAAQEYSVMYTVEMGQLLGITLTPSPVVQPLESQIPETTPTP